PLVLKLIAASIRELRSGSVSDFLNRDNTTLITCDVYYLLQQQLDRLSTEEQQVLQNLAQTELALNVSQLEAALSLSAMACNCALQSLVRRSLVESSEAGFSLRPVVAEYVCDRWGLTSE
ncbi:MAG: hypothetical protein AAF921_17820, partial [Cyanobacteria bacterium P01_D01_bin.44]